MSPEMIQALEKIARVAGRIPHHAIERAKSRAPGVDSIFLEDVDAFVEKLKLPLGDYYVPVNGVGGTVRGYVTFKPGGSKVVLATVLSARMIPKGLNLLLKFDAAQKAAYDRMVRDLNLRAPVAKTDTGHFAPGIPDRKRIVTIPPVIKATKWPFVVHLHHADKAGRHYDLRLADPQGNAHSWALRYWPEVGERRLAVQQPTHTRKYMNFQGIIEDGYGKGHVSIWKSGDVEVTKANDREVLFNLFEGRKIQEFALIRTQGNSWLLINRTATRKRFEVPSYKPKMHETALDDKRVVEDDNYYALSKLDGAHAVVTLKSKQEKPLRVFSYRTPKTEGRDVIEYTHKIGPDIYTAQVPKDLDNTILRAEVWASDSNNKPLHSSQVAGILNANVDRSRETQKNLGKLRTTVFDIVKYKGKVVEHEPFVKKLEMLRDVTSRVPHLEMPTVAETKEQKRVLLDAVKHQDDHETSEGVILQPKNGGRAIKAKIRPDHDVWVRDIFPAYSIAGKELDRAGGFEFSWEENGPIVGRVGTGFNHAQLRLMKRYPERYIGRVARVKARTKYESGALGEPAFIDWHPEKGKQPDD